MTEDAILATFQQSAEFTDRDQGRVVDDVAVVSGSQARGLIEERGRCEAFESGSDVIGCTAHQVSDLVKDDDAFFDC